MVIQTEHILYSCIYVLLCIFESLFLILLESCHEVHCFVSSEEHICHLDSINFLLICLSVILSIFFGSNVQFFKKNVVCWTWNGKPCSFKSSSPSFFFASKANTPSEGEVHSWQWALSITWFASAAQERCAHSDARFGSSALPIWDAWRGAGGCRAAPSAGARAAAGHAVMLMWCCCTCVCCERDFCEPVKVRGSWSIARMALVILLGCFI